MGGLFEKNKWFWVLLAFLISILTFQKTDIHFARGLDGSYFWAFSYLFENNSPFLSNVALTYGVLGFLKAVVAYGSLPFWQALFVLFTKSGFIYLVIYTCERLNTKLIVPVAIGILTSLYIFVPEIYLGMICLLLVVNYLMEPKNLWLYIISAITALSFYIKCSIGIECCMIEGIFVAGYCIQHKKLMFKEIGLLISLNLFLFFLFGLLFLHSMGETYNMLVTYYYCFAGHSETNLLHYKVESPWLLIVSALAIIGVFFARGNFIFKLFWTCAFLILYAEWIHSLTRMDRDHYMSFLSYLFFIICVSGIFIEQIAKKTYVLMGISFLAYYSNLNNKPDFLDFSLSLPNGLNNSGNAFLNNSARVKQNYLESVRSISYSDLVLSYRTRAYIGKKTIDFFPWDLLFVEANKGLNWKPRPYLQSLNYHSYFDKRTADYFSSVEAPEILVWHMTGVKSDFFQSYDSRDLFIDENFTIKAILCHYKPIFAQSGNIVFEKLKDPISFTLKDTLNEQEAGYKEWIKVPDESKMLMVKTKIEGSFMRTLKKLFYRDEEFQVQFKTKEGYIMKKRFSPSDAVDGIWVSPYILDPSQHKTYCKVTAIKFLATGYSGVVPRLKLQWRVFRLNEKQPVPGADTLGFSGFYRHFNPYK